MPRYRMRLAAVLCFDMVADDEESATASATKLADRFIDGLEVLPNAGLELESAMVYPADNAIPKILDTEEDEDTA